MIDAEFRQFNKLSGIIIIFLFIILAFGLFSYKKLKNFKATKSEIKLYGMFMGMNHIDIIIVSISLIQTIIFSYSAIVKQVDIYLYAIVFATTSGIYILYRFKSIIFEIINLITGVMAMYLNKTLYQYTIEVETNIYINLLQIVLTTFMILYALYVFVSHLDGIIKRNKNVRRNKTSEKE